MTISEAATKKIIKRLLHGDDYRIEIQNLLNAAFLDYVLAFFKKVIEAKLKSIKITEDWYKDNFVSDPALKPEDVAIYSGINKKTITNMYNSGTKEIVLNASKEHYDTLFETIRELANYDNDVNLKLTIKLNSVSVELDLTETLIVINSIAVKRAAFAGGLWSSAGKQVEKPLMEVLCKLYQVPRENYELKIKNKVIDVSNKEYFEREIDFYLKDKNNNYKCEVKLMGKGNPESADAVIARDSTVFVADRLSETNRRQLNSLNVLWVQLRSDLGFRRFESVLKELKIPYKKLAGDLDLNIDNALLEIYSPHK